MASVHVSRDEQGQFHMCMLWTLRAQRSGRLSGLNALTIRLEMQLVLPMLRRRTKNKDLALRDGVCRHLSFRLRSRALINTLGRERDTLVQTRKSTSSNCTSAKVNHDDASNSSTITLIDGHISRTHIHMPYVVWVDQ